jgi:asparaginyl-tRNA synthetase
MTTMPAALTNRFLDILEDPVYELIVHLHDLVTRVTTSFWSARDVRCLHLPITTDTVSSPMGRGSDSLPVQIDLFGQPTYLADSMQFMLEYGCRLHPRGTWYVMPSFRGEEADETHLNQFLHSEAELPGSLEDVMNVVDSYLAALNAAVLDELSVTMAKAGKDSAHIESIAAIGRPARLTFDEAADILKNAPEFIRHEDGWRVLTRAGEQQLLRDVAPILWVTNYDHLAVPFYQCFADPSRKGAKNADLLMGIGEVVGAGERHQDEGTVREALALHEVDPASYDWYLAMKRVRPMQTAGFGLGVERWFQWVLQIPDIREVQLVPRLNGVRLRP